MLVFSWRAEGLRASHSTVPTSHLFKWLPCLLHIHQFLTDNIFIDWQRTPIHDGRPSPEAMKEISSQD